MQPAAPPHQSLPLITQPLRDVDAWAAQFDAAALPVLAETAAAIEAMRANEDAVDARLLAETVSADPLATLKLLACVARKRDVSDGHSDVETTTAALVMLGVGPFFRTFGPQPMVEHALAGDCAALHGFKAVLRRSHRAANFATAFAVHRMDQDVEVIREAALLHDFAELLLWLRAPALAQIIAKDQRNDAHRRSAQIQRERLNVELSDLQHALMVRWRLPALLVRISDDRQAGQMQVRNVLLAIRVARHSAADWDNPALPDDIREIADLLRLGFEPTAKLLRDIDG